MEGRHYWSWCRSRWDLCDTFLSVQYLVNQWLDSTKFSWVYNWDITKNWIDFGDLHIIFKVTVVERLKIHGCETSVFSENIVTSFFLISPSIHML